MLSMQIYYGKSEDDAMCNKLTDVLVTSLMANPYLRAIFVCEKFLKIKVFLFRVTLIVLLNLFVHPNQVTSFIIYLLKFHLLLLNYTCLCHKDLQKIARKSKIAH